MDVQRELALVLGFTRAGTLRSDDDRRRCRAELDVEFDGSTVFALVAGAQIKKFGSTGRGHAGLKQRVQGLASALNGAIALEDGTYQGNAGWATRTLDPFKRLAPAVVRAGLEIEVWARRSATGTAEDEAAALNLRYRPEWVAEGHAPASA